MAFDDVKMGIKRPATLDEQLAIQSDIRAMRKAITFGQRDSALIQRCLRVAEHEGLSSEETYVLIAYHALCQVGTGPLGARIETRSTRYPSAGVHATRQPIREVT